MKVEHGIDRLGNQLMIINSESFELKDRKTGCVVIEDISAERFIIDCDQIDDLINLLQEYKKQEA